MRLSKVRITNFQSVHDSNEFEIGDVTCLVGKNEAGKTALLRALNHLNPVNKSEVKFDFEEDYPSKKPGTYKELVAGNESNIAEVVHATYELEREDVLVVEEIFGNQSIGSDAPTVTLHKGYSNKIRFSGFQMREDAALEHLVKSADLSPTLTSDLLEKECANEMLDTLTDQEEQTAKGSELKTVLQSIAGKNVVDYVCEHVLFDRIPRFLYFDEYYQMKGQDNLEALIDRVNSGELEDADHPLLGLIELAELELDQLANPRRSIGLKARLERAGNRLSQIVLKYWSQNKHLQVEFERSEALPDDPPGMTEGTNLWGYIRDTIHNVSTPLGKRSRGFLWFFSFLAWYSHLRNGEENLILLLDEPGLSLHAKAQADLLNFFENELIPTHQLIYTTHSPFMVDPAHLERVRIVQDLSIEEDTEDLPEELQGTRVTTELHSARGDSLFPLQGALGYGITQSLFVGPNCLVVEGISDHVYLQTISTLLEERGKHGLSDKWTITPVGGSSKIPVFVALLGAQKDLNVVVLLDFQKKDQQSIDFLFESKLRRKKQVLTFAEFAQGEEADIEDMFDPEFYLELVNRAYRTNISLNELSPDVPRIVRRLKLYLSENPLPNGVRFSHLRPANYLSNNTELVKENISEEVFARFESAFEAINELLWK